MSSLKPLFSCPNQIEEERSKCQKKIEEEGSKCTKKIEYFVEDAEDELKQEINQNKRIYDEQINELKEKNKSLDKKNSELYQTLKFYKKFEESGYTPIYDNNFPKVGDTIWYKQDTNTEIKQLGVVDEVGSEERQHHGNGSLYTENIWKINGKTYSINYGDDYPKYYYKNDNNGTETEKNNGGKKQKSKKAKKQKSKKAKKQKSKKAKKQKSKKAKKQKSKKTKKEEPENIKIFIFLPNNRKKINNT